MDEGEGLNIIYIPPARKLSEENFRIPTDPFDYTCYFAKFSITIKFSIFILHFMVFIKVIDSL